MRTKEYSGIAPAQPPKSTILKSPSKSKSVNKTVSKCQALEEEKANGQSIIVYCDGSCVSIELATKNAWTLFALLLFDYFVIGIGVVLESSVSLP